MIGAIFSSANNLKTSNKGSHMKSIDIKSLLIGILGTVLVMVLMGQTTHKKRYDEECITMSGKAGLIKCRRFQLDSHVRDAQDNHISTDWYNFDQANAL